MTRKEMEDDKEMETHGVIGLILIQTKMLLMLLMPV